MRTKLSILLILITPFLSIGQIKVFENNHVGIGTDNTVSPFAVFGEGYTHTKSYFYNSSNSVYSYSLYSKQAKSSSYAGYGTAILGLTESGRGYSCGVRGYSVTSTPSSAGQGFGVFGYATNATSGYNYGVYGLLGGSNYGAAIFGAVPGRYPISTGGMFAGFFRGNVYCEDMLGIGTKYPSYELDVDGDISCEIIYCYEFIEYSDINLKENISDLNSSVEKIRLLQPVEFNYKDPNLLSDEQQTETQVADTGSVAVPVREYDPEKFSRKQFGFMAQDVEKIFPEIVHNNKEGIKGINYIALIPILVNAIKDQQDEIEALKRKIALIEKEAVRVD